MNPRPFLRSPLGSRASGMALVLTLAALAVMTILLLALFAGVAHQMRGAQSDAMVAREKMLADTAVALVIGQIQQASTQTNQAWISQPGLLRTYAATAARSPTACYKLYSTTNLASMVDTSGNVNFFANDTPSDWSTKPSDYTDLNSPVQTAGLFSPLIYPIVDPAALTNSASGITGISSDTGAVTMPVAWLYELQDGTLGPASNGTASNPIVARVAFWTDDDTSKIDINTAGCGSPWNTPRVNSTDDVAWSSNQPASGEYSAYPGHPATTSLAVVFGTNSYSSQQLLGLTPRYAWGGSQFGTQATTSGENVSPKWDRMYASLDELGFSTNQSGSGQRVASPISAAQLESAKFVLTAHSEAPETTLLGEPRIAIWPVADATSTAAPRITATDAAITNAATIGSGTTNTRSYFFQRHNAQSATDDLDPSIVPSNAQLFGDLIARGDEKLPGYGTTFSSKYTGPLWTQLVLELVDFIRGVNTIDPCSAPFVPYAAGDSTSAGRAFVVPLTTTYGSGTNQVTLRGMGRCPTLSSLTLVFYVCGFNFKNGTHIDYEETPDDAGGSNWKANFLPASTNWANVVSERMRAFVVPATFHPGCGYPEVSDACAIQIKGLDALKISNSTNSGNLGFAGSMTSRPLSDALKVSPSERAWGGNEGPLAWRAAALDAQQSGSFSYVFGATNSFSIVLATAPTYKVATGVLTWPPAKGSAITFNSTVTPTVLIQDASGNTLQTLSLSLPSPGCPVPTPVAEYTQDGAGNTVAPSYYMTLRNRVLLTQTNREFLIQPGDVSRSLEASADQRVIAGLTSVPSGDFGLHPLYKSSAQPHAHNLHFADGTAAFGASGTTGLAATATYSSATNLLSWVNWQNGATTNYAWPVSAPCSVITGTKVATMQPVQNLNGDWDTGPGFSPDGAQINIPDSGTTNAPSAAYFSLSGGNVGAPTQRTPNALVPSPVIFGSLPAGIDPRDSLLAATNPSGTPASEPWRTLLFCPYPAANSSSTPYAIHPGSVSPPDHLILDNFWMPVVEPYPISTRMATAGKINLNDQIAPFTYLHRNTALRALLDDLRIPAIPVSIASTYKSSGTPFPSIWHAVDEDATIAQIESRFGGGSADAYLSESEICTVPLVPKVQPPLASSSSSVSDVQTALQSFWNGSQSPGGLTGDNLRELPYAQLYGRLTTRSNSYTVHIHAQILKKLTHDPNQNVWNEGVDLVQGDWRGSYEIERYLDPAAPAPAAGSPLGPYKFRILSARRFAP
jgi:uncharacterized protein (TIGR02600 family)